MHNSVHYRRFLERLLEFCKTKKYSKPQFETGDKVKRWSESEQGNSPEEIGYIVDYSLQTDDEGSFEWECNVIWLPQLEGYGHHSIRMEPELEKNLVLQVGNACKPLKIGDYRHVS